MVTTYLEQLLCAGTAVYLSLVCVSSVFVFFKEVGKCNISSSPTERTKPFCSWANLESPTPLNGKFCVLKIFTNIY